MIACNESNTLCIASEYWRITERQADTSEQFLKCFTNWGKKKKHKTQNTKKNSIKLAIDRSIACLLNSKILK